MAVYQNYKKLLALPQVNPLSFVIFLMLATMTAQSARLPLLHVPTCGFVDGPRLIADVGGTNARFALEVASGQVSLISVLACDAYASLTDAVRAYLGSCEVVAAGLGSIRHAAIAIANPVDGDLVRMTNHHWEFSIETVRIDCGFETLLLMNDFSALACALPMLADHQRRQIGGGTVRADSVIGLLGAGTGLGVSGLVPSGGSWLALRSEGGHATFSPANEIEVAILQYAWRTWDHVSSERFLSGDGLELIWRALAQGTDQAAKPLTAPDISQRGLSGQCALCSRTLDVFCGMLGTAAGNLAITLGAQGGIYIGGGIVPRLGDYFARSPFRARFEQKGRFSAYLSQVPTYVITADYPAFVGVSAILAEKLDQA